MVWTDVGCCCDVTRSHSLQGILTGMFQLLEVSL